MRISAKDLEATKLNINTPVPDFDLDTTELVQRIKSYGQDKQSSYSLFVKARGLSPEISAKEFYEIWDNVSANPHKKITTVDFVPTHRDKDNPQIEIMVTETTPNVIKYILSYGGTGSHPAALFDNHYEPV